ncbi:MAG: hypothetical protein HXX08_01140 [Chloroflexi bacterium]|uniref:DUF2103 domain-containing protein n=1 Tax=Candidatus Chlorohelix allophototropha TaxID=3003348 RepID=A0A8T7LYL9_9CHLR|nr:hypothetical protein [Chloroflexota bacterium]WJW66353.1 DUF2103 domain-containing protein [Chloroflexota bacterium L227-S17]
MSDKPRGLLRGAKFNGKHSTVIAPAFPVIELLRDDSRVTKIVIGVIKPRKGNGIGLKATTIDAGLRIMVSGPSSVQQFYAYTAEPEGVTTALEQLMSER